MRKNSIDKYSENFECLIKDFEAEYFQNYYDSVLEKIHKYRF